MIDVSDLNFQDEIALQNNVQGCHHFKRCIAMLKQWAAWVIYLISIQLLYMVFYKALLHNMGKQ